MLKHLHMYVVGSLTTKYANDIQSSSVNAYIQLRVLFNKYIFPYVYILGRN